MLDNIELIVDNYAKEGILFYHDLISCFNGSSFSRIRKLSTLDILFQMINRHGRTQWAEVQELCEHKDMTITDKGFFMARSKFNPEAVHVMADEFIANMYDNYNDSMQKWKDLLVLSVDGSKITVPDTAENKEVFGTQTSSVTENQPAMALTSTLHDSINHLKLDLQVDRITQSERTLALKHIDHYCENYSDRAVFVFDRGYVSMYLIDSLVEKEQYFLFRTRSGDYTKYFSQVETGMSKTFDVSMDRSETNHYRQDRHFRNHLLNTTYRLRFAKVVIGKNEDGSDSVEFLITNLPEEVATEKELKDLYWLRWNVETSYNQLKNRMKMEEFSGYKPEFILQDLYADMWMYNIVSLKIMEANEKKHLTQNEDGEYVIKRNFNKTLGTMKRYFLKVLMCEDEVERQKLQEKIWMNINGAICWVKKGERQFSRKQSVNKSSISYRKSY